MTTIPSLLALLLSRVFWYTHGPTQQQRRLACTCSIMGAFLLALMYLFPQITEKRLTPPVSDVSQEEFTKTLENFANL